jgi:phospholipid transport system substrate-binding protein
MTPFHESSIPGIGSRFPAAATARWVFGLLVAVLGVSTLSIPGALAQSGTAAPSAASATMGPQEIVENSAQRMLKELDANRAMYKGDSAKLDSLVANVLLPNFDSELAARLVLGQAWRTATADQRKRFVDAFYHSLLRNYGTALVDFTADRFKILPFRGDPNDKDATVHTEVKRSNGETVPVDFTLKREETGWKAWDVVIEGISYVKSFRTDIGAEVQSKGLDEVIDRLEREGMSPRGVPH